MILDVAYAINGMSGLCIGSMLLMTKINNGEAVPVSYRILKQGLGVFGLMGAFFDFSYFLFDKNHHLLMNNFVLPILLDFIILIIISSVWRSFHMPEEKLRWLKWTGWMLGVVAIVYLIGAFVYHGSIDVWDYSSFNDYDQILMSQVLCSIAKLAMLIMIFGLGSYTIYEGYRFHKKTKQLFANNRKDTPRERLLALAIAYLLMVIGDNIWTSVSYDIFMLFLGPVLYFFMAIETVNGFLRFQQYEVMLKLKEAEEIASSHDDEFSKTLDNWIESKRFTDPDITVSDVAKELGVSYAYMNSYFKNVVHIPFRTWRISLRMEEAKSLLLEKGGELSISEIATRVGYNDRSNFFRHFREHEGCTPDEFKSNYENASSVG